jgi:hypothetical protein
MRPSPDGRPSTGDGHDGLMLGRRRCSFTAIANHGRRARRVGAGRDAVAGTGGRCTNIDPQMKVQTRSESERGNWAKSPPPLFLLSAAAGSCRRFRIPRAAHQLRPRKSSSLVLEHVDHTPQAHRSRYVSVGGDSSDGRGRGLNLNKAPRQQRASGGHRLTRTSGPARAQECEADLASRRKSEGDSRRRQSIDCPAAAYFLGRRWSARAAVRHPRRPNWSGRFPHWPRPLRIFKPMLGHVSLACSRTGSGAGQDGAPVPTSAPHKKGLRRALSAGHHISRHDRRPAAAAKTRQKTLICSRPDCQ